MGLFKSQKQWIERRPHTISAEDATLIMNYFDMIAMKKFAIYIDAMVKAGQTAAANAVTNEENEEFLQ
jgi:hypothetical protein